MNADRIEKSIKWLRSNKYLNRVCRAIRNDDTYGDIYDALSCEGNYFICHSFTWDRTLEGREYWDGVHSNFYMWYNSLY